jgi:hypothetical protein
MTPEREQIRKVRAADGQRAAIFWAVMAWGLVVSLELLVIILLLVRP